MADFHCEYCGKYGYGKPTGGPLSAPLNPSGWVQNKSFGFGVKRFCSNKCLNEYNSINGDKASNESSNKNTKSSEQILAEAEAERIKIETEAREQELRLERDKKEREERKKRADELRSQGKNFQATVVEYNLMTVFGIIAFFAITGGFIFYMNHSSKNVAKEASEINLKLESIEDQIKLSIQDGNRDKALEFTSKLVHPMHEKWEEKFGFISGDVYYDDWWSKRRQEYKEQIMAMPNKNSSRVSELSKEEMSSEESDDPFQATDEKTIEENTSTTSNLTPKVILYKVNDPDGYSNLREEPNGKIIRKVFENETFEIISHNKKYHLVKFSDGSTGYIHESRVVKK